MLRKTEPKLSRRLEEAAYTSRPRRKMSSAWRSPDVIVRPPLFWLKATTWSSSGKLRSANVAAKLMALSTTARTQGWAGSRTDATTLRPVRLHGAAAWPVWLSCSTEKLTPLEVGDQSKTA